MTAEKIKHGQRQQTPFWIRLQGRLNEMQERRRRLLKYLYKKEGKLAEFEEGFHQSISKKSAIIKKFSSVQLEDLLRTSTKNVAQEVVSSLIPPQGGMGTLADLQQRSHQMPTQHKKERLASADQLGSSGHNARRNQSHQTSAEHAIRNSANSASAQRFLGVQGTNVGSNDEHAVASRQLKTASGTRQYGKAFQDDSGRIGKQGM